jgi:hypothetical protein
MGSCLNIISSTGIGIGEEVKINPIENLPETIGKEQGPRINEESQENDLPLPSYSESDSIQSWANFRRSLS